MNTTQALKIFDLYNPQELNLAELKKKYRQLAKNKHPDNGGNHNEFIELNEAYNLLKKTIKDLQETNTEKEIEEFNNLSKEEIISKFEEKNSQLQNLENTITTQLFSLEITRQSVLQIIDEYKQKKEDLKFRFSAEIQKLEKSVYPNFFRKLFFFIWPTINSKDFWNNFYNIKQKYIEEEKIMIHSFYKELILDLNKGLNHIYNSIKSLDKK